MKKNEREKIDNLYKSYEFEKVKECPSCNVYTYDQGYFNNAEIVVFDESEDNIEEIKNEFGRMGYSISKRKASEYEIIKQELFKGFFRIAASNERVIREYNRYCDIQSKRIGGGSYSYIESHYLLNGQPCEKNILETIYSQIMQEGSQLIILEAPAGFGKTCTAYEIVNLIARDNDETTPFLTELSKNRMAKIFRYVLLDECDKKFPRLSYDLVIGQIKAGNIPLIIDGFDELLSKAENDSENTDSSDNEAVTMLDTIAQLFGKDSKAKVLLTSRKNSIFAGKVFDNWVEKKLDGCVVNRVQIQTPTSRDWIGAEKLEYLSKIGIEADYIANPVLLSMLRNMSLEDFESKFRTAKDIVDNYYDIMLEREKERQQLLISVDEQKNIMRKLATIMVLLDFSSDDPENMQEWIKEVVSSDDMARYLKLYSDKAEYDDILVPSEDEFIMKLVHNALLDRVSINSNSIGFINDFIFGILIGDAIYENELQPKDLSDKYVILISSAYIVEDKDRREIVSRKIHEADLNLSIDLWLQLDMNLPHSLSENYKNEYIRDVVFSGGTNFTMGGKFNNCTFESCTFESNRIPKDLFSGCCFINCSFYDVTVIETGNPMENSTFISCKGVEQLQKKLMINNPETLQKDELYYEKLVLEQYWKKGAKFAEPRKTRLTLMKGINQREHAQVGLAIANLISKGILVELTNCIQLEFSKIGEVKSILGR
ncbi:MAG: hypothetical protein LIP10_09535 [Clostridiales bacterium]|nr:hypothetical protein [Clostridiales bacterium]